MFLGYNTNGFAFHRWQDALAIIAELGYAGVALTVDHTLLNPYAADYHQQRRDVRATLRQLGLRCAVETGARFLLDPRRKHQPTLLSPTASERARRLDFLQKTLELAAFLETDILSFWSGMPLGPYEASPQDLLALCQQYLHEACATLLRRAEREGVRLALEPEPGMFIATVAEGLAFVEAYAHPCLGLTVDVGHVHCQHEGEWREIFARVGAHLFHIHVEDMKRGVHDHLQFGEGEIDFPALLEALRQVGYQEGLYVELSRHAHDAVAAARLAKDFMAPLLLG